KAAAPRRARSLLRRELVAAVRPLHPDAHAVRPAARRERLLKAIDQVCAGSTVSTRSPGAVPYGSPGALIEGVRLGSLWLRSWWCRGRSGSVTGRRRAVARGCLRGSGAVLGEVGGSDLIDVQQWRHYYLIMGMFCGLLVAGRAVQRAKRSVSAPPMPVWVPASSQRIFRRSRHRSPTRICATQLII